MRSAVDHHATAASANSSAISPRRARAAANAGASPPARACAGASTTLTSGRPGEPRGREAGLALVLDPEGVDARARRMGDRQLGAGRVEDAREPRRLARLDAERHDVLDLEVDGVSDPHAVRQALLAYLDRRPLHAQALADERPQGGHRAAHLAAEDPAELLRLLVGR